MSKSKFVRMALKGSAAAVALLGAVWGAQAVETKFGEVSIIFDTTVSMGASIRTADRETAFLPEGNGGSAVDTRFLAGYGTVPVALPANPAVVDQTISLNGILASGVNRDGSINTDDGRLNYDAGDLFSANVKANHDLQMTWRNYKIFARGVEFYDFIQNDPNHTDRSALSDSVRGQVGRDAILLDAFISADYTVAELPLNIRAGKQVISWGEGTFILNGINVINPIDVTAFRRPGAEIKEGLLPVNSIYASIGLPIEGTSLAAYYMLDFEPFEIDAPGTAFSNVDPFERYNVDPHGNIYGQSFLSGSARTGSFRRNCAVPTVGGGPVITSGNGSSGLSQVAHLTGNGAAYETLMHSACQPGLDPVDYQYVIPTGQVEFIKNTFGDEDIVKNSAEREASDDGQFGVRFNWYAEQLGGTEFGFYYQNYHSRLPFVGFRPGTASIGVNTVGNTSGAAGRGTHPLGCTYAAGSAQLNAALLANTFLAPNGYWTDGDASHFYTSANQQTLFENTFVADPLGYETTLAPVAAAIAAGAGFAGEAGSILANAGASGANSASYDNLTRINCWLAAAQIVDPSVPGLGGLLMDGAELLDATNNMSVYFEYPEDIQMFGFSFNTVLFGWGVQFEATYRPNAPFQLDTDQLTIASAFTQCAAWGVGASGSTLQLLQTIKPANCAYDNVAQASGGAVPNPAQLVPGEQDLHGYIENEMFTAQIGTTATFTSSEWWLDAMGADLGIFVTEIGVMYVPGVEDTWIDNLSSPLLAGPQYANTGCQATDLPLGGFLDLRKGSSAQCRPTDFSAGLVLLYTQQYNNAFDTGFVISPQIVYSYDFEGTTPSPYGNYMEDRQALGLGVSGTLNNNFRVGVNYTAYFGGHINNKAKDQDFASFTASYSF